MIWITGFNAVQAMRRRASTIITRLASQAHTAGHNYWKLLFKFSKLTTWNLPASVSWSRKSTSCHVFVATEYRVSRDTVAGCNPL